MTLTPVTAAEIRWEAMSTRVVIAGGYIAHGVLQTVARIADAERRTVPMLSREAVEKALWETNGPQGFTMLSTQSEVDALADAILSLLPTPEALGRAAMYACVPKARWHAHNPERIGRAILEALEEK